MQPFSQVIATVKANSSRLFFSLLALFLTCASANVQGQASSYTYTALTGQSMYSISSPTTLTTVANGSEDDGNNVITLPFTFTYNGIAYTQMTVSSNGYIIPGSVPGATSTTASLFTGTPNNPALSLFGRDGNFNGSSGGSHQHGSAAGDLYVIQINNFAPTGGGSASNYITMQAVFYGPASSSPNTVEFVYGSSAGTGTGGQVGIRDAAGTFKNGLDGSNINTTLATAWPAAGTLYRFTPPPPCAYPGDQPTNLVLTSSGLTGINGSFTPASSTPTGYLVVRTTTNVQPVPVDGTVYTVGNNAIGYIQAVGNSTSFSATGLTETGYYFWVYSYSSNCTGGPLYLNTAPLTGFKEANTCAYNGTILIGLGGNFPNLTQAIDSLNAYGVAGPVVLELIAGYPAAGETFPLTLGVVPCASSIKTITIRPSATTAPVIISSNATATVDFNGGNYWIIDGRQGGAGTVRNLSITNTNTAAGTAVRFINEASNNTIKYVNLKSSFASATSGVVVFSTTSGTNGNDNNTIDNCSIDGGAGATATPATGVAQNGIYALGSGTTGANTNSGNIISNNLIFNNFVNGATNAGILIGAGNTAWTISGNNIYQTNTRTPGTAATIYGIFINNSNGSGFSINNNYIGGSSFDGTGTWTVTGTVVNRMTAIGLIVANTTASVVQGNTIAGINFQTGITSATTIATTTTLAGSWAGIIVGDGKVNIISNVIGSGNAIDKIIVNKTASTSLAAVIGIGVDGEDDVSISNNTVGGITATATSVTFPHSIIAILSASSTGGTTTINSNIIGSATVANSLHASNVYNGTTSQYINGISNSSTTAVNITNNTIANHFNATVPATSVTGSVLRGITLASGVATVTGNTIRDLSTAANATSATSPGVIGIYTTSTTVGTWSISDNTIYNLRNTNATAATYVTGIYQDGPALNGTVSGNKIYGLNAPAAGAFITGINTTFGTTLYYNNTIRLGDGTTNATIYGIKDTTGTSNTPSHYHNTVYIGGTAASGGSNSFALASPNATNAKIYKNNIFINARSNSGATGRHYAVSVAGSTPNPTGLTMDHNIYRATGTGGVFGKFNGADVANLAAWQAAVGQDANSKESDPCLANPTAAIPDLHLTNCATAGSPADGAGTTIAAVTVDMDGETRASLSPVDIGADAGIYGAAGKDVGAFSLIRPTATSCHSAAEDVIVRIKNFSTSDLDMSVDPVTITVEVTGQVTSTLSTAINTGILVAGTTLNVTVGQINTLDNGTYTFTSTAVVAGDVTAANNTDVTNVTINYTPLSVTATSGSPAICISGATSLTATPTGGTAPFTYLWDSGTTLTEAVNNTGTITSTQTYAVTVTDACGVTSTASVTVTVNSPAITGITPGTRCGAGTVTLSATGTAGSTLNWYNSPTGGATLGTGNSFLTPSISANTNFYVGAGEGATSATGLGNTSIPTATGALNERGIVFTANQNFTLVSAQYYSPTPNVTNTATVKLINHTTGAQIGSTLSLPISQGGTASWYTLNLNLDITPGTYRLVAAFSSSINRITSGVDYSSAAFNNLGIYGSITSGYDAGVTSTAYNYFHNISIIAGCESPRQAVLATVTAAPAIAASATPPVICEGASSNLLVTSSNADYTYSWTPGDLAGGAHTVSPTATTTYTVTAVDNSAGTYAGCSTTGTAVVTVNPLPPAVTISNDTTICAGSSVTLTATSINSTGPVSGYTFTAAGSATLDPMTGANTVIGSSVDDAVTAAPENIGFTFKFNGVDYTQYSISPDGWILLGGATASNQFTNAVTSTSNIPKIYPYWDDLHTGSDGSVKTLVTGTAPNRIFKAQWFVRIPRLPVADPANSTFQAWLYEGSNKIEFRYGAMGTPTSTTISSGLTAGASNYQSITFATSSASTTTPNDANAATAPEPSTIYIFTHPSSAITWAPATYLNTTTGSTVIATPTSEITYTATATLGSCTTTNEVTVSLSDLAVSAVSTDAPCNGQGGGSITATATGGTGSYEYSIDGTNFQPSNVFTGLLAGAYTVYVRDTKPCTVSTAINSVVINEPISAVTITATGTAPTCFNGSDGSITDIVVSGGVAPYNYTITGGAYTGLMAGAYTITATDANGCEGTLIVTLANPVPPVITISNNGPVCDGSDALLSVTESYFSYAWSGPTSINNASSQNATAVNPGDGSIYTVIVTDANGCTNTASTTVSVTNNIPVSVTVGVTPGTEVCQGTMVTFTATATNGGDSPTYQWYVNGQPVLGQTTDVFATDQLNDQDYVTVVMTSSEQCTIGNPATSDPIYITVSGLVFASTEITVDQSTVCEGTSVTFTAASLGQGNSPIYEWFVNGNSAQMSGSEIFQYVPANGDQVYVTMTSSFDCAIGSPATSSTLQIEVNPVPAAPVVSASGPTTFCEGGSVTLTSDYVGGNLWSNGETTDAIVVSQSGIYTVTQTQLGCTSLPSTPVEVVVNTASVTITPSGPTTFCDGESVTLSAAATPAAEGYLWSPGGETTQDLVVTTSGNYSVTTTDANGCTATANVEVTVNALPTATISGDSYLCTGTEVVLTANATAGSGTITNYQWKLGTTNVGTNSATYAATTAGSYTVEVTNSNGCKYVSAAFELSVNTVPMAGVYTISSAPASCTNFVSLAAAIGDLNVRGVSAEVIFNVASGHTETAPAGGLVINYCSLASNLQPSAANPVFFQGGAVAATITAPVGTTTTTDGIVKLVGADHITINKINLQESAANTTSTTRMEWGYALLKCDGKNGSNNNTISNCSITLNRTNTAAVGIYSGNHTATSTTGLTYTAEAGNIDSVELSRNSRNTFFGNSIQNVYLGISLNGNSASSAPHSLNDTLNAVGVIGQAQNVITNFGGSSITAYGITETNQRGISVNNNTINNMANGGAKNTTTMTGINMNSGVWGEVRNNTIQLEMGATTSTVSGISVGFSGGSATNPNIVNITGNTIQGFTYTTATSGAMTGILNGSSGTGSIVTISNNIVQNNTLPGTGIMIGIDGGSPGTLVIDNNTVTNINKTGASGTMYGIRAATAEVTLNGNTITNNKFTATTGTSSANLYGFYDASSPTVENYTNNTIHTLSIAGAGTSTSSLLYGMYSNSLSTSVKNISGNIIHSLSASVPAVVAGIYNLVGVGSISKNKIYNLLSTSASASAEVTGIRMASGNNMVVSNNFIGDLRAPSIVAADAVRGISVTSTSTSTNINLYFNTIYLAGTSSGATFGTTGIYHTTSTTATTAALDMRNNLVYNIAVPKGAGRVVAYRRSSTSLTNFAATSDNNLYYVPVASNTHVFSDGANHMSTLAAYKSFAGIAPREAQSQTENVSFQSTVSSDLNYLKVSTATATVVEGGAQPISGITTDYFGTARHTTSPDIGAHEDNFINAALIISSVTITPSATQCVASARTVTTILAPGTQPVTTVTLNYAYNGVAQTPITMSNGGSGNTYTAIIPAATPGNAIVTWSVNASDGTYNPQYTGTAYQDEQLTGATVDASASPSEVCSGSPSTLTASAFRPGVAQIGTGTSTTSTYPYYRLFGSSKTQMMYKASELIDAGLTAGPITAIGFNITSASTAMPNVKISLKQTSTTTITAFETGLTQVATEALFTPVVGVSNHPITPFVWDGVSNLIVEYCFENNDAGGSSTTVQYSNPGFAATFKQYQDNAADHCGNPAGTTSSSSTIRPNLYITGKLSAGAFTYSWSDGVSALGTGASLVVNPTVTTTYTATATDANGCSISSAPVAVSVIPLTCTDITTSVATCQSGFTLTANTSGGGAPYHYAWSDGSATVYPDSETITATLAPGTYTFTVTVTDGCGGSCTMNKVVTVNGLPTIAVSSDPASGQVCGNAATLTATGGVSYTWLPIAGLSATTGAIVQALPAATTTYTVTGTDANGCMNSATQLLTVEPMIVLNATGSPATICAGNNVQLNTTVGRGAANAYGFSASTGVALYDTSGSTIVVGGDIDDAPMALTGSTAGASKPIGFTFKYEGVTYTHFSASPDGWVHLKNATTAASSDFSNDLASTDNDPTIAPFWDDLNTGDATAGMGFVKSVVKGTAPNRILVLHWYVTTPRNTSGAANSNFQALLYEGENNKIEFRYGTIPGTAQTASVGLAGANPTGTFLSVSTTDNTVSTTAANNSNAAAPATGTMYSFTYGGEVDLEWTPTANLNNATVSNPLASNLQTSTNFVVKAIDRETGCFVKDTVAITVNPLPSVSFTGLAPVYCADEPAALLTGTPANGTFSGPGVSGNTFTAAAAGPGVHTITYTVTDLTTGCQGTTTQQVTVNQAPFFTACPTNMVVSTDAGTCTAVVNYIATVDGTPAPVVSYSFSGATTGSGSGTGSGATFNQGVTTVTITAQNLCTPVATCTFTITVNDTEAPVITMCASNQDITLDANCSVVIPNLADAISATDNCNVTVTQSPAAGTVVPAAHNDVIVVTFTATDASGNSSTCSANLTAKDQSAPVISICAANQNVNLDASCQLVVPNLLDGVTATDNCTVTLTQSPAAGTILASSHNQVTVVTITATDAAGNSSTCTANITSKDITAPVIVKCAPAQEINLNGSCSFIMPDLIAGVSALDNCGVTVTQSPAAGTVIASGHNQTHTVVFTATDAAGNSATCSTVITAKDVTAPTITSCPSVPAQYYSPANCGAVVNVPNLGTSDNCDVTLQTWSITRNSIVEASSPATGVNNVGTYTFGIGTSTIVYNIADAAGLTATCTATVVVNAFTTAPVYTIIPLQPASITNPPSSNYSDSVEYKVVIPGGVSSCGNAAGSATFTMTGSGTQVLGTANFVANGANLEAILSKQMLETVSGAMAPGLKSVAVTLNGLNNSTFSVGAVAAKPLQITPEYARVEYSGDAILALPNNTNSVTFTLKTSVMDISVPQEPSDDNFDNSPGDIRKAMVKFVNRDNNTDISGWIPVTTLITAGDTKTGTVSFPYTVTLGSTENDRQVTIGVIVNGYYTRDSAVDNTVITAYRSTGDFISGGGAIRPTESVGALASDDGRRANFGFTVKYGRNGGNPKGNINVIFRRREADNIVHSYQVKGNAVQTVGVNASNPNRQTAQFSIRTNIQDITNPNNVISLGGNKMMYVSMIDRSNSGATDSISFVLVDGANDPTVLSNIIWSSNWVANTTKMMMLNNGNVVIKSGFNVGTSTARTEEPPITSKGSKPVEPKIESVPFEVSAYPNPTTSEFKLALTGYSGTERILVRLLDAYGRSLKQFAAMPGELIRFGSDLRPGNYKVEVLQGKNRKVVNLIKL